jgi:hypothetical protein
LLCAPIGQFLRDRLANRLRDRPVHVGADLVRQLDDRMVQRRLQALENVLVKRAGVQLRQDALR